MTKPNAKINNISAEITIYIIYLMLLVLVIGYKKNFHTDELSSYILANHTYSLGERHGFQPEKGKVYSPADTSFLEFLTVDDNYRFHYTSVWKNQAADVHPPLYYSVLHTICSFFPEKFSIWFAGCINIAFSLLTLWIIRKIVYFLLQDQKSVYLCSLCFIASPAVLSANTFLRMYVMVMFEIALITYIFLKGIDKRDWKFYFSVIIISTVGALTHYYFDVWLFFICMVFFFYLLWNRKWRDLILFMISMSASGVMSIGIFPDMIYHMFGGGYRGDEAIANLKNVSVSDFIYRISYYYTNINNNFFGGLLTYILICTILIGMEAYRGGGQNSSIFIINLPDKNICMKGLLLLVPTAGYQLLVCKMVPYLTDRYMMPVYSIIIVIVYCVFYYIIKQYVSKKKQIIVAYIVIAVIWTGAWQRFEWEYIYSESTSEIAKMQQYAEDNCICVYELPYRIKTIYYEVKNFRSISFFGKADFELLKQSEYRDDSDLVVYITEEIDEQKVIAFIMENFPHINAYEQIGGTDYVKSYHMYKD